MKLKWIVLIGVIVLAAFALIQWKSCPCKRCSDAAPLLSVSANFDDLKLLNDGKIVLLPGIAACVQSLSMSWDEAMLSNAVASVMSSGKVGPGAIASLLMSANCNNDPVKGVAIDVSDVPRLLGILGGFDLSDEFLPGVAATNLSSAMLHIVPFENFASTSNFYLVAQFDYGTEALGEKTKTEVSGVFESAGDLLDWNVTNNQGVVICSAQFKLQDKAEILKRIFRYQMEQAEAVAARSQSRAAGSDDTAVEIARERQAAIRSAEEAYLRRQLYDPVVAALKSETPETQEKWKGVLTTADIMLGAFNGGGFSVYREFAGSGAECAYTNGCRYPVPIAYAHASLLKVIDKIQLAFSNLYVSVEHDTRWNAASRLAFFGSMCIVSDVYGTKVPNAPPSLTNACNRALEEATYDFLKERNYTQDEIGMAFHLARYSGQKHGALARAYQRLKAEGAAIDPWMDLMIQAQIAFRKAWDARGSGFANTVTDEGWRIYKEELDKVFPLLEKAYHLRPELSWSCSLALESALGDSYARELWLRRLLACRPDDIYGLSCYLFGLRPRWCGSNRQMARFLLGLVRKQQFDTMVPIFAYEGIVDDVFASEGGVSLEEGSFPSVDKFILACRKDFEPYFKAYHAEGFEAKLSFIERAHLYIALADLAWRLENEEELLHWAGKFEALKIPARETEFGSGYKQYGPYLAALRKLDGTKRHDFLAGLHALYMDGDPQAIDKMRAIADEIGESQLAFECALSRRGKVNLIPFLTESHGKSSRAAKHLQLEFKGRQRDHMIFRVQLRAGEDFGFTRFQLELLHGVREHWREQYGNSVRVDGMRGEETQNRKGTEISVDWPADKETCAFEFEVVGNRVRVTQDGVRLSECPISAIPSLCSIFSVYGFFGVEVSVLKLEMEVLDTMDFVIQSVPKVEVPVPPVVKPTPQDEVRLGPMIGGVYPKEGGRGDRLNPANLLLGAGHRIKDGMVELTGEGKFDKLGLQLRGFGDSATVVVDCGKSVGAFKGPEVILAAFALDRKPNRVMVVADTKSGEVYAVAQGNKSRWKGTGKVDLTVPNSQFAFSYDYAHGLSVYQRVAGGKWKLLVTSDKCRYRGEKPTQFFFGSYDKSYTENLPFNFLIGLPVRAIYAYPKVLTKDQLSDFPRQ